MDIRQCIAEIGKWEGYTIGTFGPMDSESTLPSVVGIDLRPLHSYGRCSGCHQVVFHIHDSQERWIRDLPILAHETHLLVSRRRVRCPACGPKLEQLPWVEASSRITNRLAEMAAKLCEHMSIAQVATFLNLHWDTVKRAHKQFLQQTVPKPDFNDVRVLAMDEFAIQKGHKYATVIIEPLQRRVLWVGRGRSREAIRPFFEQLTVEQREQIQAVVMDMNSAFDLEVKAQCPHAEVVYDLFHVVAKYGREVVDRVRVDEANRLKDDMPARKVVKSSKWLLLRNRENLKTNEQRVKLEELLAANEALMKVYVLKDDLKQLWAFRDAEAAEGFWARWFERATESGIKVLQKFAKNLAGYLPGILAHCRWPLHTSVLEGINNKIKVIKRIAYGFRDDEYFFLRIRAAFPGNA